MKLSHPFRLFLFAFCAFAGSFNASAQVAADVQAVETQPGVYTFSTSYTGGANPIYVWSFGDGFQANGNPVEHAYSFAGTYQVYLQVYDSGVGLLASGDTLLLVSNVTCDITPFFSYQVQPNGDVLFADATTSNSGNIVSWHWEFGDGGAADNTMTPMHTYTTNGLYTVCLTVQDDLGCTDTVCNTIAVTIGCSLQPYIAYTIDSATNTVSFVSTVSGGTAPYTYDWWLGGGSPSGSTVSNPVVTYSSPGDYGVCLTVMDANGCNAYICDTITIGSGCNLYPVFTSQVDSNGVALFAGTSSGGTAPVSYYWDLADGNTATGSTVTHQYNSPGVYTVCLIAIDANGCSAMSCNPVTVNLGGCPAQLVNLSYNTGVAGFVSYSLNALAGAMPYSVVVNYGDGSAQSGPYTMTSALNLPYTYATSGLYTACFYVTDANGCTDTICQDVNSACPAMATTFTTTDLTGGLVELNAVATGGTNPYLYTWTPATSLNTSSGATVIASPTVTTTYCVTAVDVNGCSASYCGAVSPSCTTDATFTYALTGNAGTGSVTNPVAGAQYVWTVGGNTYIGQTIDFNLFASGTYDICVQATLGNCFDYHCETFTYNIANADTLSGYVWEDADGDGFWDSGELPMPQSLVILCQPNDTTSCQYAYTDVNGFYVFVVAPDTYEISSYNWNGTYAQTFPVSPTVYTVVTTGNTNITGFDFGYQNQAVTLTGCIFYDTNNNGTQDAGETGAAYQYVLVDGWWYYTNSDGCYNINIVPGTYTITYTPPSGSLYTLTTPGSYTVNATTVGQTYGGYSFGLYADPTLQNLSVNVTPWTTVTPGFPAWYYINYCNYGATPASGTVTYTWDPSLVLTNLDPPATTVSGNTATWDFTNLAPGTCQTIYADFDAPTSIVLGTSVTTGATITPIAGDIDPTNNIDTTHQVVVGSWDPNAKEVMPAGQGTNGAIDPAEVHALTYTVHFQNTGSAPAVNVVLIDTLSSNLDWNTFKMNDASHNYTLDFNPATGIAQWTFNNIMLPDSGSDYQGSMGFVEYQVELANGLVEGETIENFADIYFDFNEAVRTNTVVNTVDEQLGINRVAKNVEINVMPNPASGYVNFVVKGSENANYKVVVRNVLGQAVRELSSNGQKATMLREGLVSGVYSFEIFSNQTILGTGTFVLE